MNRRRKIITGLFGSSSANWENYNASNDKSAVEFGATRTEYIKTVAIDSNRALLVYVRRTVDDFSGDVFNYCYGRIASIAANGDVTLGTEAVLLSQGVTEVDVKLISSTQALVACDVTGVKAFVITFSGTTISSVGTATIFASGVNLSPNRLAMLSSTQFLMGYEDITNDNTVVQYGSISGTTVTAGNSLTLSSADTSRFIISEISDGKAVAFYNNETESRLDAQLLSVSGTTPVSDDTLTDIAGDSDDTSVQSAVQIENGKLLLVYENITASLAIEGVVISEASDELSKGAIATINTGGNPAYVTTALPNSTQAVVSYKLNASGGISTRIVTIASNDTLSAGTAYSNVSGDKEWIVSAAVGTEFVALAYQDDDDSDKGKLIILRP